MRITNMLKKKIICENFENLRPHDFALTLLKKNIRRGLLASEKGKISYAHAELADLARCIEHSDDYHNHEGVFFEIDKDLGVSYWAFIHQTHRGTGQGGVRFFQYRSVKDIISDGLRLSEGMTWKNALARLWWGGAKGIIDDPIGPENRTGEQRRKIFERYGKFVSSLNGLYVAAEDMNTNPEDMRILHANCRHCTCLPEDIGGSGNPSAFTARGVQKAMEACIHFLYGKNFTMEDIHVAVQGAGNVGLPLIENLIRAGAIVTAHDTNPETRYVLRQKFENDQIRVLETDDPNEILSLECDILSPCAVGATINPQTIPEIKAKIIAGAANNQLENPVRDAMDLHKRDITYLPDFIINRIGIINCADEMYGYRKKDTEKAIEQIYADTMYMLEKASEKNLSCHHFADIWARKESLTLHPVWGHRGREIMKDLFEDGWETKTP